MDPLPPGRDVTAANTFTAKLVSLLPRRLAGRLYLIAAILSLELMVRWPLPGHPDVAQAATIPAIASYALFLALGRRQIDTFKAVLRFRWGLFYLHAACFFGYAVGAVALVGTGRVNSPLFLFALSAARLTAIALLLVACVPARLWIELIRRTRATAAWACAGGLAAWMARAPLYRLWDASLNRPVHWLQLATYRSVRALLSCWLPNVVGDPSNFTVGSGHFVAQVNQVCSGIEGLGLIAVFTGLWLWFFRREIRFPQALLLVPAAMAAMWTLNVARIAALIFVGVRLGSGPALYIFHSEAGWIAFAAVALGFSAAMVHLPWMRAAAPQQQFGSGNGSAAGLSVSAGQAQILSGEAAATPAYLMPLMGIIAASYASRLLWASSAAGFEPLYGLRLVAAAAALWACREELRKLDWRFGWAAAAVGAAVFAVWVAPEFVLHRRQPSELGAALALLPAWQRLAWIAVRIAGAAITVPMAEELAFRGYLARRLMDREFDRVAFGALSALAIAVSSLAFGLMHGSQWAVGIAAGLAYALVAKRTGRFGDAVAAHAVSNLLLAVWVLSRGDWGMW